MIMFGESRMYTCLNPELNSKPHILHPTPYLPVRGDIMIIPGESLRYVLFKPRVWGVGCRVRSFGKGLNKKYRMGVCVHIRKYDMTVNIVDV